MPLQDTLEKRVDAGWLLSFYGELLTEKQRRAVRLYCEEDLSLSEIAQEDGVSRQSVHDLMRRSIAQMQEMENKMCLRRRFSRIEKYADACREELKRIQPTPETACHLTAALLHLKHLISEEEVE